MKYFKYFFLTILLAVACVGQTSLSGTVNLSGQVIVGGVGTQIVLTSISINPPNPIIPSDGSQAFTASGTYSDGSTADLTGLATWSSSNTSVATNTGPNYQCVARGNATVIAMYQSVQGTTNLGCQSPSFTPLGTVSVGQTDSSVTIVQYNGFSGQSPYTFSSTDLPTGWTLSSVGCASGQINCSLVGIPNTVAVYSFHIQLTDGLGNTACSNPGCAVGVNVYAATSEDNTYCTLVGGVETVTGLSDYGPAQILQNCNYTAIASTPISSGNSSNVIYVCPVGQLSNGTPVGGCQSAIQPVSGNQTVPAVTCANGGVAPACGTSPYYSSTIQGAVNYVFTNSGCGSDIQIYPTIDDANPLSTQNVYTERTVTSPGSINCGPDYGQLWWWIRTKQYNNIPLPGNRISPAFVNQTSIVGRPSYPPTSAYGIPTGTYLPQWRCEFNGSACVNLSSQPNVSSGNVTTNGTTTVTYKNGSKFPTQTGCTPGVTPWVGFTITINTVNYTVVCINSTTSLTVNSAVPSSSGNNPPCNCFSYDVVVNAVLSGLRIMGIEFTAPHNRDQGQDLYGNSVCPTSPNLNAGFTQNCHPGHIGSMIYIGCQLTSSGTYDCSSTSPVQGNPLATPTGTGSQHVIIDRDIVSGCDDISYVSCYDDAEQLVAIQNGQHMSIIDSYLIGGFCLFAIGPCVESHATGGGNPQELLNDVGIKEIDNYLEASGCNFFFGGGVAAPNIFPTDIEVRRNHFFKPLTEKVDSIYFSPNPSLGNATGAVQDSWVAQPGAGYSTTPGAVTCTIDAPLNGTPAVCTPVVATSGPNAGGIVDVFVCNTLPCTSSTPAGSGYGFYDKIGGFKYVAFPTFKFSDSTTGQTYASCGVNLQGYVNVQNDPILANTVDFIWQHGNKFIPSVVTNPQLTIALSNGSNYFISAYVSNVEIQAPGTWTGTCPSGGCSYVITFPTRGDCVRAIVPIANVKNLSEFKHGIRFLWEGNHHEQVWEGASDQQGFGFLITPKNPNNGCPTCQVTDGIFRYNLFDRSTHGMQVAAAAATQGGTLSLYLTRLSIHDNVFDGMNSIAWTEGLASISAGAGTCLDLENVQTQPYETSSVLFDHNTCVATLPNGAPSLAGSSASLLSLFYNVKGTQAALMPKITFTNNIGMGGVKQNASHNSGNVNCLNQACTDQTGTNSPSLAALRQVLVNSFENTGTGCAISGGQYVCNQLASVILNNNNSSATATCSSPTGSVALIANDTGTGGSISFSWSKQNPGTLYYLKMWIVNVGSGYTVAPTVQFTGFGSCTTPPSATVLLAGANNPSNASACFDHNVSASAPWPTLIAMTPLPTAQIDPVNNSCVSSGGGGNLTPSTWYPTTIVQNTTCNPTNASALYFVNFQLDNTCQEAVSPGFDTQMGDLHLASNSPGHNAANDGADIGAHIDQVMGCNGLSTSCPAGTPSQYTGCSINASGVTTCPW